MENKTRLLEGSLMGDLPVNVSECCDADFIEDTDVCSDCKEHSE